MAYQAEIDEGAALSETRLDADDAVSDASFAENDAVFVSLPRLTDHCPPYDSPSTLDDGRGARYLSALRQVADRLPDEAVLAVLMDTPFLPYVTEALPLNFQRSIAVRLDEPVDAGGSLPTEFLSIGFFTKGYDTFSISKVRSAYRYCPVCEKTTKDYGGKKHLYHSYGTLQRDVWKHPDIGFTYDDPLPEGVVDRTRDTLSSGRHESFLAVSAPCFDAYAERDPGVDASALVPEFRSSAADSSADSPDVDALHGGDCLDRLPQLPDESVDFVFLDPPYNIGKEYEDYSDDIDTSDYLAWCEEWLSHCVRVLDEGGVLVALNLPESIHHHARYLARRLTLQNWICWDSMSRPPAGNIMPTNYPILVFSKGDAADAFDHTPLDEWSATEFFAPENEFERQTLYPLDDAYCKRESCRNTRRRQQEIDRKPLTDLWTDVYRLKHNSKREDHPTMLPPKLVRRLVWLFTDPEDTVLDPFNGVGTTTLTAAQLGRQYVGFELSEKYLSIAREKHDQLAAGEDPFEKETDRIAPPSDDSTTYKVSKKELQLEIKRVAEALGHLPSKEEVREHGRYKFEYYEEYFDSWSDATKAAKTTGMTEGKDDDQQTLHNYT